MKILLSFLMVCVAVTARSQSPTDKRDAGIPHLHKQGTATQLVVDGKPFLMLAGELGNSSASSLDYMRPIWPKVAKMHLNTLLVPVYWELLEPAEGKFDFTLVDSAIFSARASGMRIVFLWFGSWKNSMSCYVPGWIKSDQDRFPRARISSGKAQEILSPFYDVNKETDARAFAELMKHLRIIDGTHHTVVMVQVENEIGMIPEARDCCKKANAAFQDQVPSALMSYLEKNKETLAPELLTMWQDAGSKSSGTWEDVFGKGAHTDEIFMAWYFAAYTNDVAHQGKEEYPLPMYVNAALIRPGYKPGQYPSAGPLPHLMDIWRAAAPAIDFLAPDIYFKNLTEWCERFDRSGNPIFIPEAGNNQSMANAFYAFARHNAMGYSPFSIESLADPDNNQVAKGYEVLQQLEPLIVEHQGKGTMNGILLDSASQSERIQLGDYAILFRHEYGWRYAVRTGPDTPRVGGMVIMISKDEFLVAGTGVMVSFWPRSSDDDAVGIMSMDEGTFVDGKWVAGRRMNGDQDNQGRETHLPSGMFTIQKVKLYRYK